MIFFAHCCVTFTPYSAVKKEFINYLLDDGHSVDSMELVYVNFNLFSMSLNNSSYLEMSMLQLTHGFTCSSSSVKKNLTKRLRYRNRHCYSGERAKTFKGTER